MACRSAVSSTRQRLLGHSVPADGLGSNRGATSDLLLSLGFVVDPAVISDSKPGLTYDFFAAGVYPRAMRKWFSASDLPTRRSAAS